MHFGRRHRYGRLGIALACLMLGAPQAWACGWWACDEARHGYRQPPRAYGYRPQTRAYGYIYAARPSTAIRRGRGYVASGPPLPDAGAVGLTAPIATAEGLLQGGLPGRGPTLFGPSPTAAGYAYGPGYYYSNGYFVPRYDYSRPPPPTAWVERRRR
jgi:hypothetical protein